MADSDVIGDGRALVANPDARPIELARAAWLHEKGNRTGSERTRHAYTETFDGWRAELRVRFGLDVDSEARAVALVTQDWVARPRRDGRPVAASTVNQRLAILSSFYTFARRRELLDVENPISRLDRRPVQRYAGARPLDALDVTARLAAIDRTRAAGLRDYALYSLALSTGRRLSELAALDWRDVQLASGRALVT